MTEVVAERRLCTTCGDRRAEPRYVRCKRCRGSEYNQCECGEQKTLRARVCIRCRRADPEFGEAHPSWKGGRVNLRDGYVRIYMPEHPRAVNGRYVLEHILVMEERLGRFLLPGENVHHINGIRDDNRPENLELWASAQPPGQRIQDLLAWARELIARYEGVVA